MAVPKSCRSSGRIPQAKIDRVWDAIALHSAADIAERKGPEVALVHFGAHVDVMGLRIEEISPQLIDDTLALHLPHAKTLIADRGYDSDTFRSRRASSHSCSPSSNGRKCPPTLPGAIDPRVRHACARRTPVAALTSSKRAAARAESPRSSARQKRIRKSSERGFVHAGLLTSSQLESQSALHENPADSINCGKTLMR